MKIKEIIGILKKSNIHFYEKASVPYKEVYEAIETLDRLERLLKERKTCFEMCSIECTLVATLGDMDLV